MRFPKAHTLFEIAQLISAEYVGPNDFPVLGMNEIHVVEEGDIVFVDHPKYYNKALESAATIILINKKVDCPKGKALLISDDPFRDFNILTLHFKPFQCANTAISKSATIGDHTIIHSNVSIYDDTIIGNNVTIHAGTILGASAFYYKNRPSGYDKLQSGGRVVIENNVDIGALCTIDKGVTGDTTIGAGSKLDNQIQIGHDTVIGSSCLIASQTGIAGCVVVEDEVTIWGQVGVKSGITIAKGSILYAQSGLMNSTRPHTTYFGSPAVEAKEKFKEMAYIKQIPELVKKNKNK